MSQTISTAKIRNNPKFTELVGKRTALRHPFADRAGALYSYMLLVSLQPQLFAAKDQRRQRHHHRLADRRADRGRRLAADRCLSAVPMANLTPERGNPREARK